jgi:hypothetical protein
MNKRGQLTIFIIIAILIVAIVVGFFLFRDNSASSVPREFQPIYNNFITCMEQDLAMGVSAMGTQGGYLNLPEYEAGTLAYPFSSRLNFVGTDIPYWYYISGNGMQKNQIPTAESMQAELEDFISLKISSCGFDSYYDEGFSLTFGEAKPSVRIKDNEVILDLEMDFVIYHGDDRVTVKNHKVIIDSSLGSLYKDALKVYGYEQEELFLEKYGIDVMNLYAPVDGVEFTCSPKVWIADNIFYDLEEAIEVNTMAIKSGSDNDYFSVDVDTENEVSFFNSRNWPRSFEVNPTEGNVMIANPVGNQPGLGVLGFCYVTYHFVYNINYPVLVQITSDSGEVFQFPLAVVIKGNKEREALPGSAVRGPEIKLCEDKNSPTIIHVFDSYGNEINANLSYKCLRQTCGLGETVSGSYAGLLPQCVNGFISAQSRGYEEANIMYSSVNQGQVSIFLDKEYEKPIRLFVEGERYNGNALINFIGEESSKAISYPEQDKVTLSEGEYEVHVYVYRDSSLSLPEFEQEQCVDVPRGTLGGVFGLTKEQCYDVKISEQAITNALSGGGRGTYPITEEQLSKSSAIEIDVEGLPSPNSLKQIQENYILFESSDVEVRFT